MNKEKKLKNNNGPTLLPVSSVKFLCLRADKHRTANHAKLLSPRIKVQIMAHWRDFHLCEDESIRRGTAQPLFSFCFTLPSCCWSISLTCVHRKYTEPKALPAARPASCPRADKQEKINQIWAEEWRVCRDVSASPKRTQHVHESLHHTCSAHLLSGDCWDDEVFPNLASRCMLLSYSEAQTQSACFIQSQSGWQDKLSSVPLELSLSLYLELFLDSNYLKQQKIKEHNMSVCPCHQLMLCEYNTGQMQKLSQRESHPPNITEQCLMHKFQLRTSADVKKTPKVHVLQ